MSIEDERAAWLAFKAADPAAVHECGESVTAAGFRGCPVCRTVTHIDLDFDSDDYTHIAIGFGTAMTNPPPDPWPGQVWRPLDGGDPWMVQGFLDGVPWRWRFQQFRHVHRHGEQFAETVNCFIHDTITEWPPKGCECLTTGWTP